MLPKTNTAKSVSNSRPIANVRLLNKLFAYLMLGRMEDSLEAMQPEEQHGFRQGRRIEEHFLTANVCLQKTLAASTPLWIISLDLFKAFFLSFARSSHLDPKRTWTCFHNILQMLPLQLTIGYNFGLPPTNFARQNIDMKTKRVPDPTFWAVGLCFWMVRWKVVHPIIQRHPSNGCGSPRKLIGNKRKSKPRSPIFNLHFTVEERDEGSRHNVFARHQ